MCPEKLRQKTVFSVSDHRRDCGLYVWTCVWFLCGTLKLWRPGKLTLAMLDVCRSGVTELHTPKTLSDIPESMGYQKDYFIIILYWLFQRFSSSLVSCSTFCLLKCSFKIQKRQKKKKKKGQNILNFEGVPDALQHSCSLFIHFTVITVVKREKKLIRELWDISM